MCYNSQENTTATTIYIYGAQADGNDDSGPRKKISWPQIIGG
jgi:hypothetical protein